MTDCWSSLCLIAASWCGKSARMARWALMLARVASTAVRRTVSNDVEDEVEAVRRAGAGVGAVTAESSKEDVPAGACSVRWSLRGR